MKWSGLATSFGDERLWLQLRPGRTFSELARLRDQFTRRKRPKDSDPPQPENQNKTQNIMAKLLKLAETKDVTPGQAAAFTVEGQKIALFNVEGTYYAIGDTCTHRGGPLSEGDGHRGNLSVARCAFRPENRRCFGAAGAEGRSKLQSHGRRR